MTVEELTAEIKALDKDIEEVESHQQRLLQKRAEIACPYIIGQRMKRDIKRWNGLRWKESREVMEITEILPYDGKPYYRLRGVNVLMSGGTGRKNIATYNSDNWTPVEVSP